jgi:hypothetical protein
VLTDGRIYLGLHQMPFDSPALSFVHPGVARYAAQLAAHGVELSYQRTAEHEFHNVGLKDPAGQMLVLLEARTYSPLVRGPQRTPLCGYFEEFSIPSTDFAQSQAFWEPLGFVATAATEHPYPRLPLTSDHLDLAFHVPRMLQQPMLVFREHGMGERLAHLRALDGGAWLPPPNALDAQVNGLLRSPEGTALLFLEEDS